MKDIYKVYAQWSAAVFLLVLLQIAFGDLLRIGNIQPNLILVGLVFAALRFGQLPAMLMAFPAGLLFDLYAGDIVGLSSLCLTIASFVSGYFYDPDRVEINLRSPRTVLICVLAALLHNLIFVFAYMQTVTVNIGLLFWGFVVGSAAYSAILSALPVLIYSRTDSRLRV